MDTQTTNAVRTKIYSDEFISRTTEAIAWAPKWDRVYGKCGFHGKSVPNEFSRDFIGLHSRGIGRVGSRRYLYRYKKNSEIEPPVNSPPPFPPHSIAHARILLLSPPTDMEAMPVNTKLREEVRSWEAEEKTVVAIVRRKSLTKFPFIRVRKGIAAAQNKESLVSSFEIFLHRAFLWRKSEKAASCKRHH